jgi:hypothetical protein
MINMINSRHTQRVDSLTITFIPTTEDSDVIGRVTAAMTARRSTRLTDTVVIINGLAAILLMIGYGLFGVTMIRTATLPHWSGVLVAITLRPTYPVSGLPSSSRATHGRSRSRAV